MSATFKLFFSVSVVLLACILLLNLTACSSINRQVKYDHAQNFESMQTYNFQTIPESLKSDRNFQLLQQANITLAIENAMAGKKIRKETYLEPDFWLNYYYTGEQSISHDELNQLFDYNLGLAWDDKQGSGQGKANTSSTFSRKTLIIDLVSPESNRLIWRGSTVTRIKPGDSSSETQQALQKAAQGILKPFPPKNVFGTIKQGIPD